LVPGWAIKVRIIGLMQDSGGGGNKKESSGLLSAIGIACAQKIYYGCSGGQPTLKVQFNHQELGGSSFPLELPCWFSLDLFFNGVFI